MGSRNVAQLLLCTDVLLVYIRHRLMLMLYFVFLSLSLLLIFFSFAEVVRRDHIYSFFFRIVSLMVDCMKIKKFCEIITEYRSLQFRIFQLNIPNSPIRPQWNCFSIIQTSAIRHELQIYTILLLLLCINSHILLLVISHMQTPFEFSFTAT